MLIYPKLLKENDTWFLDFNTPSTAMGWPQDNKRMLKLTYGFPLVFYVHKQMYTLCNTSQATPVSKTRMNSPERLLLTKIFFVFLCLPLLAFFLAQLFLLLNGQYLTSSCGSGWTTASGCGGRSWGGGLVTPQGGVGSVWSRQSALWLLAGWGELMVGWVTAVKVSGDGLLHTQCLTYAHDLSLSCQSNHRWFVALTQSQICTQPL